MTGGDTGIDGAAVRCLESAAFDTGFTERGPDGLDAHFGHGLVAEAPERVQAYTCNLDHGAHRQARGAKAFGGMGLRMGRET